MYKLKFYLTFLSFLCITSINAQLQVVEGGDPAQLVQNMLLGAGVTAENVVLTGAPLSIGTFTTGASPTNLGLTSGLILTSGLPSLSIGPNVSSGEGNSNGTPGDPLLTQIISPDHTHDACVLEFDFIPQGDTMRFRYVFGSEEYPEYVNSFNDVFGFFVSGTDPDTYLPFTDKNIAIVPGTTNVIVSINNINNVNPNNPQYYVDNTNGATIEYDGFTTVLTAWIKVVPCTYYHIKLSIADANDEVLDSGVFLEEGSFSSAGISVSNSFSNPNMSATSAIEGCNDLIITFKIPYPTTTGYIIPFYFLPSSTAIYGIDYDSVPTSVIIPAGLDSASIIIHPIVDNIAEGPETVTFMLPTTLCMSTYDTVSFEIIDYTSMSLDIGPPDTLIQCGSPITLTGTYANGIGPWSFNWNTGATNSSISVTPLAPTQYLLNLTDACNFTVTDSIMVNINGIIANAGADTSICYGGAATLIASGGTSYQWSNGTTSAAISVTPTVTTSYFVTATDFCSDIDTVVVSINPLPLITTTSSTDSICPGESVILNAGGASSYQWTATPVDTSLGGQANAASPVVTPLFTTTYSVTGTDTNTCVNQTQITVTVNSIPLSTFTIDFDSVCIAQSVNINYTGFAIPGSLFQWDFDGGQSIGSGAGPINVAWTDPGIHHISLQITQLGCQSLVTSDSVFVIQVPVVDFIANQTSGCPPLLVNFTDLSQNVIPGAQYIWSLGNGQASTNQNPWFNYNKSGIYSIQLLVSNKNGCADTMTKTAYINVYNKPDAILSAHPDRVSMLDPVVKFYDHSFGIISGWNWDFGDQTFSNLQNPVHTYSDTGLFIASLCVTNFYGCTDSSQTEIVVYEDNTIYFPTAFSPNSDGRNDVFFIYGTNVPEFHIEIFDRWGGMVFSSDDMTKGWDGTNNGSDPIAGVYVVRIRYRDALGAPHSYYGNLTLLK